MPLSYNQIEEIQSLTGENLKLRIIKAIGFKQVPPNFNPHINLNDTIIAWEFFIKQKELKNEYCELIIDHVEVRIKETKYCPTCNHSTDFFISHSLGIGPESWCRAIIWAVAAVENK